MKRTGNGLMTRKRLFFSIYNHLEQFKSLFIEPNFLNALFLFNRCIIDENVQRLKIDKTIYYILVYPSIYYILYPIVYPIVYRSFEDYKH